MIDESKRVEFIRAKLKKELTKALEQRKYPNMELTEVKSDDSPTKVHPTMVGWVISLKDTRSGKQLNDRVRLDAVCNDKDWAYKIIDRRHKDFEFLFNQYATLDQWEKCLG